MTTEPEPMSNAQREELLAACARARAEVKHNAAAIKASAQESLRRLRRERQRRTCSHKKALHEEGSKNLDLGK